MPKNPNMNKNIKNYYKNRMQESLDEGFRTGVLRPVLRAVRNIASKIADSWQNHLASWDNRTNMSASKRKSLMHSASWRRSGLDSEGNPVKRGIPSTGDANSRKNPYITP